MSTNRDPELDEIEKVLRGEPTPYIEKPDDLPISDGSTCFMDKDRACGPDCRAYDVEHDQGPDVCVVLGSMIGLVRKGSVDPFTAAAITTVVKAQKDKARAAAAGAPVPDPAGGKR